MVDVRLLGTVTVGGHDALLGGRKQRGLFAMLAGSVPHHRTDGQLIDGLWAEDPPPSARNAIQVYVTGLRRALAPHGLTVVRVGEGYTLSGDEMVVDSVRFETLVARGRAALRADDDERAVELLERALSLWRGTPFDGAGELPLLSRWRESLSSTRQAALADLATAQLRTHHYEEALVTAQLLVDDHPFDERGWVALATGEYWLGRQADALATCRRARDLLASELAVDPGPELADLPARILRQEMGAGAAVADDEAPSAESSRLPALPERVVGREDLVADIEDGLARGRRLTTLTGLGGIGKTTVALSLAHRLSETGHRVVFTELESETSGRGALERVCRALGLEAGEDPAGAVARAPADVVILDNAEQVRDLGSSLAATLRHVDAPRFVVTSRTPVGLPEENLVAVPPLSLTTPADGDAPASALFWITASRLRPQSQTDEERDAAEALCELVGGIPLAIELTASRLRTQSATHLLAQVRRGQTSLLEASRPGVPDRQSSMRVVLESAVEALSPLDHDLLRLVSSVDGWVRRETVEEMMPGQDVGASVERVVDRGLVGMDERLRLRAPVPVREFVRLSSTTREAESLLVDGTLALAEVEGPRLYDADAEAALSRLLADEDVITTVLTRACADDADAGLVSGAARVLVSLRRFWLLASRIPETRRVIATLRHSPRLAREGRIRVAILDGTLAQWLGAAEAVDLLRQALHEAEQARLPHDRLTVSGWCSLAASAAVADDVALARASLESARQAAASTDDASLTSLVHDLEAFIAAQAGDHETALRLSLEALEASRASGDERLVVSLLATIAENLAELGRDAEAVAVSDESFELARRLSPTPETSMALAIRAEVQVLSGRAAAGWGSCLEALRAALVIYPSPKLLSDGLVILAAAEVVHGWDRAAARLVGAAMAMRADAGLRPEDYASNRVGALAASGRERLGASEWDLLAATAGADPMATLERALAERS